MKNIISQLESLIDGQEKINQVFKPVFYRLQNPGDEEKFNELLSSPGLILADHIFEQVKELVKFKNPSTLFSPAELEAGAKKYIGDVPLTHFGVWVYYPWSNRLVHTLDREDFIETRTSRNQNKITRKERDILTQKKIGVIGLSVGQSVSVTIALERISGEIRLADFDTLELTNLNRIRTGIHNLGLPKVYSVAREIAEIDPYINVICFPEGLTEANMDSFFLDGGKLDLLVEESDGFDIKILSRYKARALGVPVIMEASDRCAVDIERFDLHPDRSILHGLVDHLDVDTLKSLKTNDEKIPYMLEVLGLETSSLKLKASMLEIGQSINTWPQLASAVTMGGGITADISRRMLLNQYTQSGRFHVDIEELIGEPKHIDIKKEEPRILPPNAKKLSNGVNVALYEDQLELSKTDAEKLVMAGSMAPSGGNIQPWRWVYRNGALLLFNAFDNNARFMDYDNLLSYTDLGAATENIILQASQMGLQALPEFFPDSRNKQLIVLFRFFKADAAADKLHSVRASAIANLSINLKPSAKQSIEQNLLDALIKTTQEIKGFNLRFFTSADNLNAIGDLLGEIEKIRLLEKEGHRDFVEETRWTKEESESKQDGIDISTFGLSNTELISLQVYKSEPIRELINAWNGGGLFKKITKRSIIAAGAIGIITADSDSKESRLLGGMAAQRIALDAANAGLSVQPMSTAVFLFNRSIQGKGGNLSVEGRQKLDDLRPVFEKTFLIKQNCREIFIFRLSKAGEPGLKMLRKPLDDLFYYT